MSVQLPAPGTRVLVPWEPNASKGGVKSNRLGSERISKIILPAEQKDGPGPKPGQTWLCEVVRVTNPNSERRGAIIVRPLNQQLDCAFEGVWIPPEHKPVMAAVLRHPERNLMLLGDQGCGKTTIAQAFARSFNWEFRKIEGSQIKKYSHVYGRVQQRVSVDKQLIFEWQDSPLPCLIREANANLDTIFLAMIDEYTRIDEDARDVFLPVIEGSDRVLQTPKPETLAVPRNIRWMAAGNVGGAFTIKMQDAANNSRWVILEMPYMPFDVELSHCLRKYPSCPREPFERGLKIAHVLRKYGRPKMRLSNTVCTRMTETLAMLIAEGVDLKVSMFVAVANQFHGSSTDHTSERGRVMQKIADGLDGKDIERELSADK